MQDNWNCEPGHSWCSHFTAGWSTGCELQRRWIILAGEFLIGWLILWLNAGIIVGLRSIGRTPVKVYYLWVKMTQCLNINIWSKAVSHFDCSSHIAIVIQCILWCNPTTRSALMIDAMHHQIQCRPIEKIIECSQWHSGVGGIKDSGQSTPLLEHLFLNYEIRCLWLCLPYCTLGQNRFGGLWP